MTTTPETPAPWPYPDVTRDQAVLLAMHAQVVQGGYSGPEREAARLQQSIDAARIDGRPDPLVDWRLIAAEILKAGEAQRQQEQAAAHPTLRADERPEVEAPPFDYRAAADDELARKHALYLEQKATADDAAAAAKATGDDIKALLSEKLAAHNPRATKAVLRSEGLPPLGLTYSTRWSVDTKTLKAKHPEVYVDSLKQSGSWALRTMGSGS